MLRVAVVTAAATAALATSCFTKPDKPQLQGGGGDDGGPRDGLSDSPGSKLDATSCGVVHDDFETDTAPCGAWGTASNPAYMTRSGGLLHITPPIPGGSAACTTEAFKFDNGTSIEIPTALIASMADHSWIKVSPAGQTTDFVQISIFQSGGSGVQVQASCSGPNAAIAEQYAALTHRYWRFTPQNGGGDVKIESGFDAASAMTFAGLADCDWLAMSVSMVTVTFGAATGQAPSNTGTFDNFNTNPCPPP